MEQEGMPKAKKERSLSPESLTLKNLNILAEEELKIKPGDSTINFISRVNELLDKGLKPGEILSGVEKISEKSFREGVFAELIKDKRIKNFWDQLKAIVSPSKLKEMEDAFGYKEKVEEKIEY